jgi:pimeloyl-ACP methyl ester carboxylesterase
MAVQAARVLIDRVLLPRPEEVDELRASAAFYVQPSLTMDPRRFFSFLEAPTPAPDVTVRSSRPLRGGRGSRVRLTFPSVFEPANAAYAAEHATRHENRLVHVEHWRHDFRRPVGTVIGLHGFGMGNPTIDALALMAPDLFDAGLDVALMTLPLHGARAPRTARFSGQLFASVNVPRLNESLAQAVHDVAALVTWLRARNPGPLGVVGLSLGGYLAALMAGLTDDLDFVIPVVAPVCFGDLAHRFMATSALYRNGNGGGLDREEFRSMYRLHSPLAHPPRLPKERLLIIAARGDRIVPAEHSIWLWRHWGAPRLVWFTGSHLVPFGRGSIWHEMRQFLTSLRIPLR